MAKAPIVPASPNGTQSVLLGCLLAPVFFVLIGLLGRLL